MKRNKEQDAVRRFLSRAGTKGGQSRARLYSREQLRAWARLGGRPRKNAHIVYTIGHSMHSLERFGSLLDTVKEPFTLIDVRRYPTSRRYPHFNQPSLRVWLEDRKVRYVHLPVLGGFLPASPKSKHPEVPLALRGFADFMGTRKFAAALDGLLKKPGSIILMCSEGDPAKCHRSLITKAISERGIPVFHILPDGSHVKVAEGNP
jgi:uncharacterized protein (DUF488 family)